MRLLAPASWAACAREVKCSNSQHEPTGTQTGFCVCSVTGNRGFHTDDRQQDIDTDEPSNRSALHPLIKSKMRRDGGTGRRSGLKIRRLLRSWGFDPPSRHQQNKEFRLNWPLEIGEAKIVWWL